VRERTSDEVVAWAIDTFGVVPYCWGHWLEFFPQLQRLAEPYTGRAQGLAVRYGRHMYDMDLQRERMASWEAVAARWSADGGSHRLADLPHGPEDEGIVVAEAMQSVIEDRRETFIVNTMNESLVPNLPAGTAVEVPAVVSADGIHPFSIGNLPTGLAAVLSRHALVERLTAEAALAGDRSLVLQAMTADPLLDALLEPEQIRALTDEMLEANAPYLPRFGGRP
jgi:alpha-galactosidase/6-phospho-beta-glucosidase family protein